MSNIISFQRTQMRKGGEKMSSISKERMFEIEKTVNDILADTDHEKNPCIDIVSLVKKDGFTVKTKEMDLETTGCILVDDNAEEWKRIIMVNTTFKNPEGEEDVIFKKSRFITAHEFGHFILHREKGQPIYAHRDTYHRTEPTEVEADYFARAILMPLQSFEVYNRVLNKIGNNDSEFTVGMLSKIFKVTANKVRMRLEDISALS